MRVRGVLNGGTVRHGQGGRGRADSTHAVDDTHVEMESQAWAMGVLFLLLMLFLGYRVPEAWMGESRASSLQH